MWGNRQEIFSTFSKRKKIISNKMHLLTYDLEVMQGIRGVLYFSILHSHHVPFESHICACILWPFPWKLETYNLVEKCFACKAVICLEMLRCCKDLFIKPLVSFFLFQGNI